MRTLGSVVFLCTAVYAQSVPAAPSVRAAGNAMIYVKPDLLKIDIGVVTQGASAEAAAGRNARQTEATLIELRSAMGSKAHISTINYAISPDYRTENGKSTISGYTANNTVEVSTDDLADAGKIIDTASAGGANQIQNLQFGLQDQNSAEAQALHQASLEARSNAAAMADALGMELGPVISIQQGTPEVIRPWRAFGVPMARVATPVEPPAVEIQASVTLVVALRPGSRNM
jgi:uncharacterized protein YggE